MTTQGYAPITSLLSIVIAIGALLWNVWQKFIFVKPNLQEAAIEDGVMGDDKDNPLQQIVDGSIVNAVTGDHLIGNAGNLRDLGRDRKLRIFKPLPETENPVNPPALPFILKQADPEFDDFVVIGIGAGGFDIDGGSNELWTGVGWGIFSQSAQPTGDTIISALSQQPGHLFECGFHSADIADLKAVFNC